MAVERVAAKVVEVLARAESLFTSPGDPAVSGAVERIGQAADASGAIVARTAELSGATASAHRELLASAAQRLEYAAGTDAQLADHVAGATETHHGVKRAQDCGVRCRGRWGVAPRSWRADGSRSRLILGVCRCMCWWSGWGGCLAGRRRCLVRA